MKVVAINSSPRIGGNTEQLIKAVFDQLKQENISTELIQIGGQTIRGCLACMKCWEKKDEKCVIEGDKINELIQKLKNADCIILGSPTYFGNVSSELKAFIDRVGMTSRANGDLFKRKLGAAVVAVRRSGAIHVFNSINHFFLIGQMIVVGSNYWNNGFGLNPGDVQNDQEGIQTMKNLGANIVWLLKKLKN
ncbi:MAG: flavodoxin family protein [Candidatus Omnitrophota bacterium]